MLARALELDGLDGLRTPWTMAIILFNIPLALLLLRPDPQSMGLAPDGDEQNADEANTPQAGMSAAQALRGRYFKLLALASLLALMAQVGTIAHVFTWGVERANAATAAITLALLAFCSLTGRLICGAVLDRLNLFVFVLIMYALQALAMFGMAFVDGIVPVLALTAFFRFHRRQCFDVSTAFGGGRIRFARLSAHLKCSAIGDEWRRRFRPDCYRADL
jgi:predicted MFS family arabinose efflux permease